MPCVWNAVKNSHSFKSPFPTNLFRRLHHLLAVGIYWMWVQYSPSPAVPNVCKFVRLFNCWDFQQLKLSCFFSQWQGKAVHSSSSLSQLFKYLRIAFVISPRILWDFVHLLFTQPTSATAMFYHETFAFYLHSFWHLINQINKSWDLKLIALSFYSNYSISHWVWCIYNFLCTFKSL